MGEISGKRKPGNIVLNNLAGLTFYLAGDRDD